MQNHNHDNQILLEVIRPDRLPHHALLDAPSQRTRYWAFVLMALMMALCLYLFLSANQIVDRVQGRVVAVEDSDAARIRQYNEKLESLQNRMTAFVADSVETKIKTLERNVSAGTVGTQEIKTLEELKGEVKLLETYSGKGGNLTDPAHLDHPRFQITPGTVTSTVVTSGDLLYEISQMRRLLYISIASCGLVGLMIGGYWWQSYLRSKRLSNDMAPIRLLPRQAVDD